VWRIFKLHAKWIWDEHDGWIGVFLGLQTKQHPNGIFISQEKYDKGILKKYKMNEAKIMVTPMHPSSSLDKDESGKSVYEKEYRGMIGSLYQT